MKAIPIWSVLILLVTTAWSQEYPANKMSAQFRVADRVVTGHGLCVPIKVNGKKVLLTAAHIVKNGTLDADEILVDYPVGWIRCKVIKINVEADLCLLEPMLSPEKTVKLNDKDNEEKEEVFNPNFFSKMKMQTNSGLLLTRMLNGNWMARIEDYGHGSSGSPLYTKDGKLCGLGVAGYSEDGGKTMTFAIVVGRAMIDKFLQSEK